MPAATAFRISTRSVFLTYPRCNKTPDELLAFFTAQWDVQFYCICSEEHADTPGDTTPGLHLHAWFRFETKLDSRNCAVFDMDGYHPHIEKPRAQNAVLKYIRKGGIFIEEVPPPKVKWSDVVSASTKETFLELAQQADPKTWVIQNDKVIQYAEKYFGARIPYSPKFTEFPHLPDPCKSWIENEVISYFR